MLLGNIGRHKCNIEELNIVSFTIAHVLDRKTKLEENFKQWNFENDASFFIFCFYFFFSLYFKFPIYTAG